MIEWINFIVLIASALLYLYFYVKSAGPAALEKKIGKAAYPKCARYRLISAVFSFILLGNYVVYFFYPLPVPIPQMFPWDWWISVLIAVLIAFPGGYLLGKGAKAAGEESMKPKKEHTLYGGIYNKMRHPQAVGEAAFLWVIAFLLNSPFLVFLSFFLIPIYYEMCRAEEKDLVIRYGKEYIEYKKRTGFIIPKRHKGHTGRS